MPLEVVAAFLGVSCCDEDVSHCSTADATIVLFAEGLTQLGVVGFCGEGKSGKTEIFSVTTLGTYK